MAHIFNRHDSVRKEREKLERLNKEAGSYVVWHDGEKYKYTNANVKNKKYLKRRSNKKIRSERGELPDNVHKLYDYEWELY